MPTAPDIDDSASSSSTGAGLDCASICDPSASGAVQDIEACGCACEFLCVFDGAEDDFSATGVLACGTADQPFEVDDYTVRCLPAPEGVRSCADICGAYTTLDGCIDTRGFTYCIDYFAELCAC